MTGNETPGAERCGIAHVANLVGGNRRNETDAKRAVDPEVVAEPSGQHQLGDLGGRDASHTLEHRHARGDRALAELHLADVLLGEDDVVRRAGLAGARDHDQPLLAAHPHALAEQRG